MKIRTIGVLAGAALIVTACGAAGTDEDTITTDTITAEKIAEERIAELEAQVEELSATTAPTTEANSLDCGSELANGEYVGSGDDRGQCVDGVIVDAPVPTTTTEPAPEACNKNKDHGDFRNEGLLRERCDNGNWVEAATDATPGQEADLHARTLAADFSTMKSELISDMETATDSYGQITERVNSIEFIAPEEGGDTFVLDLNLTSLYRSAEYFRREQIETVEFLADLWADDDGYRFFSGEGETDVALHIVWGNQGSEILLDGDTMRGIGDRTIITSEAI